MKLWVLLLVSAICGLPKLSGAESYRETVLKTAEMARDRYAQANANKFGLALLNITWEDTGRFKGSSVGPNISDMTIQVAIDQPDERGQTIHCMPVIRFPNFGDITADLDPRQFTLLVGNEAGEPRNSDLKQIKDQILRVYTQSDYVGSLVTAGETGRVTEYDGLKVQPPSWWSDFWKLHEANTGDTREEAMRKLRELLGEDYRKQPVTMIYLRDLLANVPAAAGGAEDGNGGEKAQPNSKPKKPSLFQRIFGGGA